MGSEQDYIYIQSCSEEANEEYLTASCIAKLFLFEIILLWC